MKAPEYLSKDAYQRDLNDEKGQEMNRTVEDYEGGSDKIAADLWELMVSPIEENTEDDVVIERHRRLLELHERMNVLLEEMHKHTLSISIKTNALRADYFRSFMRGMITGILISAIVYLLIGM